jgi:hypothetical protein
VKEKIQFTKARLVEFRSDLEVFREFPAKVRNDGRRRYFFGK